MYDLQVYGYMMEILMDSLDSVLVDFMGVAQRLVPNTFQDTKMKVKKAISSAMVCRKFSKQLCTNILARNDENSLQALSDSFQELVNLYAPDADSSQENRDKIVNYIDRMFNTLRQEEKEKDKFLERLENELTQAR